MNAAEESPPFAKPTLTRRVAVTCFLGVTAAVIAVLSYLLPPGAAADLLLDREGMLPYPASIQNLMYLGFAIAIGDLFYRRRLVSWEASFFNQKLLPEDEATVLQPQDLGTIRQRLVQADLSDRGLLPGLIDLCILQFQAGRSVSETVAVMNSSLELTFGQVDLRYSMVRYVVWALPTFGFIGTVMGIASALSIIGVSSSIDMKQVSASLGVAFNTTLIALLLSAVLVLVQHLVQSSEEEIVNRTGDYCLRNLINRLYSA